MLLKAANMTFDLSDRCTAFDGETCLAEGTLRAIAPIVRQALLRPDARPVFFFHDRSGRSIDLDLRGSEADMLAPLVAQHGAQPAVRSEERRVGKECASQCSTQWLA